MPNKWSAMETAFTLLLFIYRLFHIWTKFNFLLWFIRKWWLILTQKIFFNFTWFQMNHSLNKQKNFNFLIFFKEDLKLIKKNHCYWDSFETNSILFCIQQPIFIFKYNKNQPNTSIFTLESEKNGNCIKTQWANVSDSMMPHLCTKCS